MARNSRIVAPGHPHHVTQRGNQKNKTFFGAGDYRLYLNILAEEASAGGCEVWCYCLMPNHVHLVLQPQTEKSLARTVGETHRRYTSVINGRNGTTGYLWQGRFWSAALDDAYVLDAMRYILKNPVDGRRCKRPTDWPWSSARAHAAREDDHVVSVQHLAARIGSFDDFMDTTTDPEFEQRYETALRRGWPVGDASFVTDLEAALKRKTAPGKRGRPRRS